MNVTGIPIREPIKKNRLMSIDPSINNLGMAIWDIENKKLLLWKLIHPKVDKRKNEYDKSLSMSDQLREWAKIYNVNHMILEVPDHWSVGGFEARESGSIAKLCFVCGLIYGMQYDMEGFEWVLPRGWKGQLPKEVVANRLQDEYVKYGIDMNGTITGTKMNENVMDAIAIGHYKLFGSV
jgi:hypothetical protein